MKEQEEKREFAKFANNFFDYGEPDVMAQNPQFLI